MREIEHSNPAPQGLGSKPRAAALIAIGVVTVLALAAYANVLVQQALTESGASKFEWWGGLPSVAVVGSGLGAYREVQGKSLSARSIGVFEMVAIVEYVMICGIILTAASYTIAIQGILPQLVPLLIWAPILLAICLVPSFIVIWIVRKLTTRAGRP